MTTLQQSGVPQSVPAPSSPTIGPAPSSLAAANVSAWFGTHKVLERISLQMEPGKVTALIGPSGCGKSTFLRILNRMHELIPSASLSGSIKLDGVDIYGPALRVTETRLKIGMVFQRPNPFPSMTIAQNVLAGLRLSGTKVANRDALVKECLERAGLWREARNRLNARHPSPSNPCGFQLNARAIRQPNTCRNPAPNGGSCDGTIPPERWKTTRGLRK